jgi:hypothetical protein
MLQFFKNLLKKVTLSDIIKKPSLSPVTPEEELMNRILEITQYERLNDLFYNPISKLYVFNTYSSNFSDLSDNFFNSAYRSQIVAVNLHSFFHAGKVNIKTDLEKIARCIPNHRPNMLIQHDLHEIINAFEYLLALENKHVGK